MNLWQQFSDAWAGRNVWRRLRRKNGIRKKDIAIFLIERDEELNDFAIRHAEEFRRKKFGGRVFFISPYREALQQIPDQFATLGRIQISVNDCEKIKKYYQLVKFSDYTCFITLSWPESNWAYRLLDRNGVDKEAIVCLGFYTLRHIPKGAATGV